MRHFLLLLLICCAHNLFAQKLLRLETVRNPKKIVYFIGSPITFRMEDEGGRNKIWFTERIVELDLERQLVIFDTWQVNIADIMYVRQGDVNRTVKTSAKVLQTFGASAIFFGLAGKLAPRCDNCKEAVVVGIACLATGSLVDWLVSGRRIFKIGKKNKLRLLDLTPKIEVKPV